MLERRVLVTGAVCGALAPFVAACSSGTRGSAVASSPSAGAGSRTRRLETSLAAIEVVSSTDLDFWSERIEHAAPPVHALWGRGASIAVRVCDDAEFAQAAGGLDGGSAAVTTPDGVFVGPGLRRSVTRDGVAVVLAHELTHARLGHFGSDRTQWWLKEGVAEWTASGIAPALPARQLWPDLMAALDAGDIPDGPPERAHEGSDLGYEWAHAYVEYLVEQDGRSSVQRLVRARPANATQRVRGRRRAVSFTAWLTSPARASTSAAAP